MGALRASPAKAVVCWACSPSLSIVNSKTIHLGWPFDIQGHNTPPSYVRPSATLHSPQTSVPVSVDPLDIPSSIGLSCFY